MQRIKQFARSLVPVTYEKFIEATEKGDLETVNRYIRAYFNDENVRPLNAQVAETHDTALMIAVSRHHHEIVAALLKAMGFALEQNKKGHTALMIAAKDGCDDCINMLTKTIRKNWAHNDPTDNESNSALMHAIMNDHPKSALRLLEPDARSAINLVNKYGDSILMLALRHRLLPVASKLLELKVDTTIKNQSGETAKTLTEKDETLYHFLPVSSEDFLEAAKQGNLARVQKYIAANRDNSDMLNVSDFYDNTALMLAAKHGHLSIVEALLAVKHININAMATGTKTSMSTSGTALTCAVIAGHSAIVEALLKAPGIEINPKSTYDYRYNAIYHAAKMGHIDVIKALLTHPQAVDYLALAIDTTIQYDKYECFKFLLSLPGIVQKINEYEYPILMTAALKGNPNYFIDLLALPDININIKNNRGETTLMELSRSKHIERLEMLLQKPNLEINAATKSGKTALMKAIHREKVISTLVEAKADINRVTTSGNSALMLLLSGNHWDKDSSFKSAHQLLKEGADTTLVNETTQSAISLCGPIKRKYDSEAFQTFFKALKETHDRQMADKEKQLGTGSKPSLAM